jgi:hypothetical protein
MDKKKKRNTKYKYGRNDKEKKNHRRRTIKRKKEIQNISMEETTKRKRTIGEEQYEAQRKLNSTLKQRSNNLDNTKNAHELMLELEDIESNHLHSTQLSSRARYRKEGERNTKFFFKLNKEKCNPSIIYNLQNENEKLINETNKMRHIASRHHKRLQAPPSRQPNDNEHIETFLQQVKVKLNDEEKNKMGTTTKEEDVRLALKQSENGVSAGFDGIPYEFYKYWAAKSEEYKEQCEKNQNPKKEYPDIIWILTKVFNEIEETGLEDPNFILGAIHLLYKKNDKTKVENYRPITLTNAGYKLFTKSIATKLGEIAHNIIHPNQAGFIPGRGLYDNTRLTEAMISYCDIFNKDGIIVALDQEKAYNKITHDYPWKVLQKFEFPPEFIFKIQQLYKGARTAIMVNGTVGSAFDVMRGVRQGCPMSCLLYNIAIEPLAIAIRNSDLEGFKIPGLTDRILVSLFADDTLVYLNKLDDLNTLRTIINDFCRASTAKFNLAKTEYLPIGSKSYRLNVENDRKMNNLPGGNIENNVQIIKEGESLQTLGAWVGNGNNQYEQWEKILKRQKQIMDQWKPMNLSLRGKELVLKALIQSRALFLATVNGMPQDIQTKMEKQMHTFLWNDKKATMIWEEIIQPREIGGLGIPDIKARIEAIDIMWLKKYLAPKNEGREWAFVVDQLLIKNVQRHPKVEAKNITSWISQSWNEHDAVDTTLPKFVKNMLKTGRRYNVSYDALQVALETKIKFPIMNHIAITNLHLFNKKAAKCLKNFHKINTVKDLQNFIETDGDRRCKRNTACIKAAKGLLNTIAIKLNPNHDNQIEIQLDHTPQMISRNRGNDPKKQNCLIDPNISENGEIEQGIRIFGNTVRSKARNRKHHNLTSPPPTRPPPGPHPATCRISVAKNPSTNTSNYNITGEIENADGTKTVYKYTAPENFNETETKIAAIANALSKHNGELTIVLNDTQLLRNIINKLKEWEDKNFDGVPYEQLWRQTLYGIRKYNRRVYIRTAQSVVDANIIYRLKSEARTTNTENTPTIPEEDIPPEFKRDGARIQLLTQKMAYTLILKQKKKTPGTHNTRKNIETIKNDIKTKTKLNINEKEIWESINKDHIPLRYRDFTWKMIHNRQKVGHWFGHIPGWEDKKFCTCGEIDTIKHIILECILNKAEDTWNLTKKLWEKTSNVNWLQPNLGILMAPTTVKLPKRNGLATIAENTKYHQLIAETAWIIWLNRNNRIFN